jgi:oxygen-dependent protoporphyrinogen oxidase
MSLRADRPAVAVIGAGLCGLTAAHRVVAGGCRATVFESSDAIGGRVHTYRSNGYQVDVGASAFSGAYEDYIALVDELGVPYRPVDPWIAIARGGRLHLLNADKMLSGGLRTRLLSPAAKLRVARLAFDVARAKLRGQLDYSDMRKAAPLDTETARAYALRRLSAELDQYLCEPIARMMLIADSDKVSKVELFSGVANILAARLLTFEGGQGRVCEMLAAGLDVRTRAAVERVVPEGGGVDVTYREPDGQPVTQHFDAAIVTAPLPVAARICPQHAHLLEPLSGGLRYTRALKVALGFRARPNTPAFLVQFPSSEDPDIALLFLDHNKCADRAPPGHALIDACWETDASARMMHAPDEEIVAHTLKTIVRVYPELEGTVDFRHVTRWELALPHTAVGAYRRIGEFNAALDPRDPVRFAADYMSAAGQNTAVALGNRAAASVLTHGLQHAGGVPVEGADALDLEV